MSVKFQVHDVRSCAKRVAVEYSAEAVEREKDRAYRDLSRRVRVDGFRPGKAPRRILERSYGAQVNSEVLQKLISDAYRMVQQEQRLTAVGEPKIEEVQMREGIPLTFTMELEVLPNYELPDLSGLEFARKVVNVTDEAVARELEYLRNMHAQYEVVEDPVVEREDLVVLSYEEIDPESSAKPAVVKNYQLLMGQHASTRVFEDQLLGMRPQEVREVVLERPGSDADAEGGSKGKSVRLRVSVHEIKKKKLPALDDEFARSIEGCETLEDLKKGIRERLEAFEDRRATEGLHRDILERVVELKPIDVPEALLERELQRIVNAVREEMRRANEDLSRPELDEARAPAGRVVPHRSRLEPSEAQLQRLRDTP